ncbi:hypothetical protein DFO50_103182 [Microvirgula sp. AG722]|uniref:hypothetical protein n=1 Tax=Microvirgula sp. AG722 TaxID=2183901 RepID=UPI000DC34871|nr:hypothetical protein [Microvirgula sp. AG722]RAS17572.1 hypothetical protein DFO50_103182 [Microvirgula sp. AG722]
MSANARKAEAAVYGVLDMLADSGGALDANGIAEVLFSHFAANWAALSLDDKVVMAHAVAALSLAGPCIGPIGRASLDDIRQAAARGERIDALPVGGRCHERE